MQESSARPEETYRHAKDAPTRRLIQKAVIDAYRPYVVDVVREMTPAEHVREGEQVGLVGLLNALADFDPTRTEGRAGAFWSFASRYVREEIRDWLDVGMFWSKGGTLEGPNIEAASKPEEIYRAATDGPTRRGLRTAVVAAYRPRVAEAVRRSVPARHVEDATQAGVIGVLRALEKYEPTTGDEFWPFASQYVRDEVQAWADHAVEIQRAADAVDDGHGTGVAIEIELPSGRLFELDLKTCDKQWATLQEFVEALEIARKLIVQPVDG